MTIPTVILVAGNGTRMGDDKPKVLLPLGDKSILERVLDLAVGERVVVVRHKAELVRKEVLDSGKLATVIYAGSGKNGTAASLEEALCCVYTENVLVLYGDDSGLYKKQTIKDLIKVHKDNKNKATVITSQMDHVSKIGGLRINKKGVIQGVWDAEELEEKGITNPSIFCGAMVFSTKWIKENIKNIKPSSFSGEYGIPSLIKTGKFKSFSLKDPREWNSVNKPEEYKEACKKWQEMNV